MRQISESKFDFDLEDTSLYLSCAIKTFRLVQDELSRNILAMDSHQKFLGTAHMKECCDAMYTVLRELDRIQADMDSAITAAFTKGD